MTSRDGFSLIELATTMLLLGILLSVALPAFSRGRDSLAVRGARGEIVSAFALARAAATAYGGASVVIDTDSGTLRLVSPANQPIGDARQLRHSYHVTLASPRGRSFAINYDRLGIGRLANTTLHIQRGRARQTVTVSAYGRVR